MTFDVAKIEELIKVLQGSLTEEISVRKGDSLVTIRKGAGKTGVRGASVGRVSQEPDGDASEAQSNAHIIRAPMVGIFHSPNGSPSQGAAVAVGDVVGTIESMKLLNDVLSDASGVISEMLVEDGTPVEYGQPLCTVDLG